MKMFPSVLAGVFLVLLFGNVSFGEGAVDQLITDGKTAYAQGDYEAAKKAFEGAYELDRRNTTAIHFLQLIKAQGAKGNAGGAMQKQLEAVIIPKVEFNQATLGSVLDFVKKQVEKVSEGKVIVNFVVQLPPEQVQTQPITLSLANVPASEVVRYIGALANVQFQYQQYAVIVKPKHPTAQTTAAPEEKPKN